jgi:hypothetical protein
VESNPLHLPDVQFITSPTSRQYAPCLTIVNKGIFMALAASTEGGHHECMGMAVWHERGAFTGAFTSAALPSPYTFIQAGTSYSLAQLLTEPG